MENLGRALLQRHADTHRHKHTDTNTQAQTHRHKHTHTRRDTHPDTDIQRDRLTETHNIRNTTTRNTPFIGKGGFCKDIQTHIQTNRQT